MILKETDDTKLLIYVGDRSQILANYMYWHGSRVNSCEEFYKQVNQCAADEKIIIFFYIKDRSVNATFHYESIESFNSSKDFVVKGNVLGARGYRLTETKIILLKLNTSNA